MLKTITPAAMKRSEMNAMQAQAVTGDALMQTAAAHVAQAVRAICPSGGQVVCVCGSGNNGGDGLAAMRMLAADGYACECWLLPGKTTADWQRERERLPETVRVRMAEEAMPDIRPDCAVDAMFGTGLTRPLEGFGLIMAQRLNAWHDAGVPVVAVDIPSGLNGLTGEVNGTAVRASQTITFHRPKTGLYLGDGPDHTGKILVGEIGLPPAWDTGDGCDVLEESDLARLLPCRRRCTHKGSYGKVLLAAGSRGMAGAAALAATAALRTGAGLVQIACPETIVDTLQALCPCATCLPLPADAEQAVQLLKEKLRWADALAVGCGLGTSPWAEALLNGLMEALQECPLPTVLDADALNLLANGAAKPAHAFVTPHPAEAARLLHMDTAQILADPQQAAQQLARQFGAAVVKGACSVLCDGRRLAINPFGTPAMAKGGSGDVLTGVLAALLAGRAAGAYAMTDLEAMQAACALHGLAGEEAARIHGERGVLATDLCACLGRDFSQKPEHLKMAKMEVNGTDRTVGRRVAVTVEHPLGQREAGYTWPLNCGYVQQELEARNEWQDACIVGVEHAVEWFEGVVLARLKKDGREWWAVGEPGGHAHQQVRRAAALLQAEVLEEM